MAPAGHPNPPLQNTVDQIRHSGAARRFSGKVRENFVFPNGRMAIVVTDRISVFDYKIGTVPYKGQVLNRLAAWWFDKLSDIGVPHHLISVPHPNVSEVKYAAPLPVEFVMRAYLTGTTTTSSWFAYRNHDRMICGLEMPRGMKKNERFPTPICTPTTKATVGHDVNLSVVEIIQRNLLTEDLLGTAQTLASRMFAEGQRVAEQRGLMLVDTKYEFGITENGELLVIDEVHTPDSSRYWLAESYPRRMSLGQEPESLDKEFVRQMIINNGYDVTSTEDPSRFLTDEMRTAAAERYLQLYARLTGNPLEPAHTDITDVISVLDSLARN
jgi:phosphoribosylaminoimidazole-succinocarboxamide synthase